MSRMGVVRRHLVEQPVARGFDVRHPARSTK
jgi:hypothetical protein